MEPYFKPIEDCFVMLRGVTGSHAYGLAHADSDVDMKAVAVKPTREFLGFLVPNVSYLTHDVVADDVDVTVHEVRKFIGLCLKSNPTASELLWLNDYDVMTDEGRELVAMRESLLSSSCVRNSYYGYARSQVELMQRRGVTLARIGKAARHALRMMDQGVTLWRTGQIVVKVDDPDELRTRAQRAVADPTILEDGLARLARVIETEPTPLAEEPDVGLADEFVRQVRLNHLHDA